MRFETSDGAKIEYGTGRSYYPNFVALDTDGVYWIIEGKGVQGREDSNVEEKRVAASLVLREMEALSDWADTRWGYLIAYEDDIAQAGTWTNLKKISDPKVMIE